MCYSDIERSTETITLINYALHLTEVKKYDLLKSWMIRLRHFWMPAVSSGLGAKLNLCFGK